jgi:hypothetical protein
MQSYREDSGSRPVTQLDPLPPPSARLDDMSKYQARYEEAMNPFEAFRGRVCRYYNVTGIKVLFFPNRKLHGHTKISIQLNEVFLTLHVQFSETALLELSSSATRWLCTSLLCSQFMNVRTLQEHSLKGNHIPTPHSKMDNFLGHYTIVYDTSAGAAYILMECVGGGMLIIKL